MKKTCTRCGKEKNEKDFREKHNVCKKCHNKRTTENQKKREERRNSYLKMFIG